MAAAQRNDRCLVVASNVKAAAAQKIAGRLIASGLVKEIRAKAACGQIASANYVSTFVHKPQISLAFGPQGSNGRDVLRTLGRLQDRPADEMIGEFFGPARLVSGPGLAVVAATAPPKPRG